MSTDFLREMASASRARLKVSKAETPEHVLRNRASILPPAPRLQLHPQRFDLIAEIKLRSPAAGQLKAQDHELGARASEYASAGAAAVSVLTEPTRFDGTLAHLKQAVDALAAAATPAMRKDFLVDPYQIIEARAAGAGGVLVILRMLSRGQTDDLIVEAREQQLFVLLEAFDEGDIEAMHEIVARHGGNGASPLLAGLNCRDLTSLQVVPGRLEALVDLLPGSIPRVAESGLETPDDARRLAAAGYQLALVGSALMRAPNHAALIGAMLAAGRHRQ